MNERAFIDSNVVLYLLSSDTAKADRAETVLAEGGIISVQVLNEVANVTQRKLGMSWAETDELLRTVRAVCAVEPVTLQTHELGCELAQRCKLSVYDAMIVAAAVQAGCERLFSEDMQHGLRVDGRLAICNPFIAAA